MQEVFAVDQVDVTFPTVMWNTPTGSNFDLVNLPASAKWKLVESVTFVPGTTSLTQWAGDAVIEHGTNVMKLEWSEAYAYDPDGYVVQIFAGGTAYRTFSDFPTDGIVTTGSYQIPTCTNQSAGEVTFSVYVDSPDPDGVSNECPSEYVSQNGICIKNTTTSVFYPTDCPEDSIDQDGICIDSTITSVLHPTDCPAGYVSQDGICIRSTVILPQSPTVTLLEPAPDYCAGRATFSWTYSDPEGNPETAWQMQVSTDNGFSDIVYDSCVVNGTCDGGATTTTVPVLLDSTVPHINYNTSYYWRVRVWDGTTGDNPAWTTYSGPFTTYAHPGPAVSSYTVSPTVPIVDKEVTFTDNNSKCYNTGEITSYNCSEEPLNTYQWWFESSSTGTPIYCTDPSICSVALHTYEEAGLYSTKLQICDHVGAQIGCCYSTQDVTVGSGNAHTAPQWWEISPY